MEIRDDMERSAQIVHEDHATIAKIALAPPTGGLIAESMENQVHEPGFESRVPRIILRAVSEDQAHQAGERQIEFGKMVHARVRNVGDGDRLEIGGEFFGGVDAVEKCGCDLQRPLLVGFPSQFLAGRVEFAVPFREATSPTPVVGILLGGHGLEFGMREGRFEVGEALVDQFEVSGLLDQRLEFPENLHGARGVCACRFQFTDFPVECPDFGDSLGLFLLIVRIERDEFLFRAGVVFLIGRTRLPSFWCARGARRQEKDRSESGRDGCRG